VAAPTSHEFFQDFQKVGDLHRNHVPLERIPPECINRDSVQARIPKQWELPGRSSRAIDCTRIDKSESLHDGWCKVPLMAIRSVAAQSKWIECDTAVAKVIILRTFASNAG
jgi:hypothetical protein